MTLLGCGGGSSSQVKISCDSVSGTSHSCYDQTLSGGDESQARSDCGNKGGTLVSSCSHTGAVGGCQNVVPAFGGTATTILWFYDGDAASQMGDCINAGGTWVNP